MTFASTQLDNEFAVITAAEQSAVPPRVRRSWVNVPTGGHVSAVHWGDGAARVVLLHDVARSARSFDRVALTLRQPSVAIDLPGHGRSTWRRDGRYVPRRLAAPVAEAIISFAPQAELLVGVGLGGQVALSIAGRRLRPGIRQLALVEPLPGLTSAPQPGQPHTGPTAGLLAPHSPVRFASPNEAADALRRSRPGWPQEAIDQEIATELDNEADGSWAWRHHLGNLPPATTADAADAAAWEDLANAPIPVYILRGSPAGPTEADTARVQFITVAGAGDDPVTLAPAALAANIDGLLPA